MMIHPRQFLSNRAIIVKDRSLLASVRSSNIKSRRKSNRNCSARLLCRKLL